MFAEMFRYLSVIPKEWDFIVLLTYTSALTRDRRSHEFLLQKLNE